jgi:hypothetical protein
MNITENLTEIKSKLQNVLLSATEAFMAMGGETPSDLSDIPMMLNSVSKTGAPIVEVTEDKTLSLDDMKTC